MPSLPRLFTGSRAPSIHSALAEPSTSPPSSPPPSPTPARVKIERSSPPPVSPKEDERPLPHRGFSLAVPQQGSVLPTFHQQSQSERDDAQTAGMSRALRERPSRETMRSRRRVMSPTGTAASAARGCSAAPSSKYTNLWRREDLYSIHYSGRYRAFLFQTALAGDTSQAARIISMALSLLITILTLQLFTRQLQAEVSERSAGNRAKTDYASKAADHAWLEDWEKRHGVDERDCAHGATWAKYRSVLPPRARHFKALAAIRGFTLWSNGMMIIGCVALGVLIASALNPTTFQNCQND